MKKRKMLLQLALNQNLSTRIRLRLGIIQPATDYQSVARVLSVQMTERQILKKRQHAFNLSLTEAVKH